MRKLWIMLVIALLVSACETLGGPPEQQAATPEPTEAADVEPTVPAEPTTLLDQVLDELPPPGTAIIPVTEEASSDPVQTPFVWIIYEESGGVADTTLYIEIYPDGRVVRDGVQSTVPQTTIGELTQALADSHFFGIQGVFTRPGGGADQYEYVVTVELESGASRRIDAQDGLTPPELQRLFSLLRNVGT